MIRFRFVEDHRGRASTTGHPDRPRRHRPGCRPTPSWPPSTIGLYKSELIRGPTQGPRKTVDDVELATLGWVHCHNSERLHGYLGDVPPAEFEAAF